MVFDSGRGIEETFGFEGKTASGEGQRGNGGSDGEGSRRGNAERSFPADPSRGMFRSRG